PQGLRMLLGAFRGGNPLERIVAVPFLWPRPGGVLQQHGLGVIRPSGGANAGAGCWPTPEEHIPSGSDRLRVGLFTPAICGKPTSGLSATQGLVFRYLPPWPLFCCNRSNYQPALSGDWQRGLRLANCGGDQCFHIWLGDPTGPLQSDEARLFT